MKYIIENKLISKIYNMRFFTIGLSLVILIVLVLSSELNKLQNIYHPVKFNNEFKTDIKAKTENVYFFSKDGTKINALYIKAKPNKSTVIAFHGNSGNIEREQNLAKFCVENGYGVLLTDYRGYGKSSGSPTEKGLYMDAEGALKFLANKKHLKQKNLFVWGVSLGSAVATDLASKYKFKGVILSSTFTNIDEVASELLNSQINKEDDPFKAQNITYFIKLLPLFIKYDNFAKIKKINSPILIINSKQDKQFSHEMAEKLATQNKKAKLFLSEYGAHSDIEWMKSEMVKFLRQNN